MKPKAVAVIGASAENGKIGNSVMKKSHQRRLPGEIYPIHPKATRSWARRSTVGQGRSGRDRHRRVRDSGKPGGAGLIECGEKKIVGAISDSSGYAETGNINGRKKFRRWAEIRHSPDGPNIYGFYYIPANLCATFCTAYDVKGSAALSSQSGGIGMAIIAFRAPPKWASRRSSASATNPIIDEDDLFDLLRAGRQYPDHRATLRGPEGRTRLRRSRQPGLERKNRLWC